MSLARLSLASLLHSSRGICKGLTELLHREKTLDSAGHWLDGKETREPSDGLSPLKWAQAADHKPRG